MSDYKCPKCGNQIVFYGEEGGWIAVCPNCNVRTDTGDRKEKAVACLQVYVGSPALSIEDEEIAWLQAVDRKVNRFSIDLLRAHMDEARTAYANGETVEEVSQRLAKEEGERIMQNLFGKEGDSNG